MTLEYKAEIATTVCAVTADVDIVKVAVVAPGATVTVAGALAAVVLALDSDHGSACRRRTG